MHRPIYSRHPYPCGLTDYGYQIILEKEVSNNQLTRCELHICLHIYNTLHVIDLRARGSVNIQRSDFPPEVQSWFNALFKSEFIEFRDGLRDFITAQLAVDGFAFPKKK